MEQNADFAHDEYEDACIAEPAPRRWRTLGTPCVECDALVDAVDFLPLGIILVDGLGKVVFTNRFAADILASGNGIGLTPEHHLAATRPMEAAALKALIDRTVRSGGDRDLEPTGALQLSRSSRSRPLSVIVAPLRHRAEGPAEGRPGAAVMCGDPDRDPGTPQDMLASLYGLTPCEATLALELLCGRTLERAAARLSISMNTARTHLKHVFRKTGTNRQSDFLRLVFRSPVALYL
jgi:DNA-binding CsgD family transcriptional regulator